MRQNVVIGGANLDKLLESYFFLHIRHIYVYICMYYILKAVGFIFCFSLRPSAVLFK